MLSNDWIVMNTFGLQRWETPAPRQTSWRIERELARRRFEAEERAAALQRPPRRRLAARLFSALLKVWPQAPGRHRPAPPRTPASRV